MIRFDNEFPRAFFSMLDEVFEVAQEEKNNNDSEYPNHDVHDTDNEIIVELELAGIKKEDISIISEDGTMTIECEREKNKDKEYLHTGIYYGKYKRVFNLPDDTNPEKIKADLVDGILTIKIPKVVEEVKKKKKIKVK